jgi:signal transduction histidine kinase/ActR/RegA family two-component response regulator
VATALNRSLDRKTVFKTIFEQLGRVVKYDGAGLFLPVGGQLVLYDTTDYADDFIGYGIPLDSEDPVIQVFKEWQPIIIADVHDDPRWKIWPGGENIRSWMGVPLFFGDKAIGVLTTDSFEIDSYGETDAQILQIFANQAAIAIENARLYEAEHKALEQAETLYTASLALSATIDLQHVLERILAELRHVVPYDSASVQEYKENCLQIVAGTGFPDPSEIIGITFDFKTSDLNRELVKTRTAIILEDASQHPEFQVAPHSDLGIRAWMGIPLLFGDQFIGKIAIDKKEPGFYTREHVHLATAFAAQAAIAIKNAHLFSEAERARKEAEQANRAKSTFLATMSHELRTPLNGILGYAQILKQEPALTENQRDGLNIIEQSGNHLLTLINDLLDVAKVEAGKLELHPVGFHFPTFLKNIGEIIRVRAEYKGVYFCLEHSSFASFPQDWADGKLPIAVYGDEKRLRQVLINLLGNAIKFTDQGSVTFKIELIGNPLSVDRQKPPHNRQQPAADIRFTIEDTGIGISPEDLQFIFEPFKQVGDQNRWAEGSGLGLVISQKLIELMGGQLHVESRPGQGSKFWFDITLSATTDWGEEETGISQKVIGVKGDPPTILVVDDKWENRAVLVDLLSPLGFNIIEAGHGREGLAKAVETRPVAIITDLVMSEMDGFELTRQIRQSPSLKDTVIIAVSASAFEDDHQKSIASGSNAFIPKPLQADLLLEQLQKHLSLEWVYCKPDKTEKPTEFVVPPFEELSTLLELSLIGDAEEIQNFTTKLVQANPQFEPFANEIKHLAKQFQLNKISNLLQSHLG